MNEKQTKTTDKHSNLKGIMPGDESIAAFFGIDISELAYDKAEEDRKWAIEWEEWQKKVPEGPSLTQEQLEEMYRDCMGEVSDLPANASDYFGGEY